ncbi:MAG: hypothetical protein RL220_245 [Bacteroidota bacterium]
MPIRTHIRNLLTSVPVTSGKKVLMWHNVVDNSTPVFNLRTHSQSDFHLQIKSLQKRHTIVGPEEWVAARETDPVILITFDDGLKNNKQFAVPVLEDCQCPAVFFVSTRGVNTDSVLWPDEVEWMCFHLNEPVEFEGVIYRKHKTLPVYVNADNERLVHKLKWHSEDTIIHFIESLKKRCNELIPDTYRVMSSSEILSISKNPLFTIGSHSHRHLPLAGMDIEMQRKEISTSLRILTDICSGDISCLAFPDGSYNENTLQVCSELRIPILFGVVTRNDMRVIPRTGLYTDGSWKYQLASALS